MTQYVATINIPGYLPMDDDPPVFDSISDAWEYLADERKRGEDDCFDGTDKYSETVSHLAGMTELGTVYGDTPGSDSEHDLGLAYSVSIAED